MTSIVHADTLLREWAEWSRTEGVIPKKLQYALAKWQSDVPSDYPEEPQHYVTADDDTMGVVDAVLADMSRNHIRYYVVIVAVYRNHRNYAKQIEDDAIQHFANLYRLVDRRRA